MKLENYNKEDFQHSFVRRKLGHDYKAPCRYHIIIKKKPDFQRLGEVIGDINIPYGTPGCVDISLNPIGKIIKDAIENFPMEFPYFQTYQYKIMPDHLHWFLYAKERLPKHLGKFISFFKANVSQTISTFLNRNLTSIDIFHPNYTDKIIYPGMNFNVVFNYIRENPLRLATMRQNPEFFQRINEIKIGDGLYSSYGNQYLLKNPFKEPVIIHRKYSSRYKEELKNEWMRTALAGGVLVSAYISPYEKIIREEAEMLGSKFILIQNTPFGEKFKPAKHYFELCSQGKLLIIAPKGEMKEESFREQCLKMNKLAEEIAKL